MSSRHHTEKRNFMRNKIETPTEMVLASEGVTINGTCRDLSGGGMLIETTQKLDIGAEVEVQLASVHPTSPMLRARSMVARVQQNRSGYMLGLEILEILE